MEQRVTWPAAERNRDPILAQLRNILPERGLVLELGSGTGQHTAHFASALPTLHFQPSDVDDSHFNSVRAWCAGLPNVQPPVLLDACAAQWPIAQAEAVYNANTIHIAPWEVCLGVLSGVAGCLAEGGPFVLYGPFRIDGAHTSKSNEEFDQSLRARNPTWGVRDLEAVQEAADAQGLRFERRTQMPANNQLLVFRKDNAL